jgi:hypothetical protein
MVELRLFFAMFLIRTPDQPESASGGGVHRHADAGLGGNLHAVGRF